METTDIAYDKQKLEVRMSRVFSAPREKLWQAHTDPELVKKWWGPRKYDITVEKLETRVGGEWKMVHTNVADNERHVFYGKYLEVVEPEKITWTFIYEPFPGSVVTETLRFEELADGKTELSVVSKFPNIEALEGMAQSGMEEGAKETWDRLEELTAGQR